MPGRVEDPRGRASLAEFYSSQLHNGIANVSQIRNEQIGSEEGGYLIIRSCAKLLKTYRDP